MTSAIPDAMSDAIPGLMNGMLSRGRPRRQQAERPPESGESGALSRGHFPRAIHALGEPGDRRDSTWPARSPIQ